MFAEANKSIEVMAEVRVDEPAVSPAIAPLAALFSPTPSALTDLLVDPA